MTVGKISQSELEGVITNGQGHTYAGLCTLFAAGATQSMQIDRTLQKLRRNKKIKFKRVGRQVLWSAVKVAPEGAA